MSAPDASRFVEVGGVFDARAVAAHAGAIVRELDARGATSVVAALASRRWLASVVAACAATDRRVVFPHGFGRTTLHAIAAEHGALILHDRAGLEGLDVSTLTPCADGPSLAESLRALERDGALTFLTSGTTGTPKRVPKSGTQILAEARALVETLGIRPHDRVALGVPSTHFFGFLFGIALPCVVPLDVEVALVRTRADLASDPRWLVASPPTVRSIAASGALYGTSVVSSGAPLSDAVAAEALASGAVEVVEILGSTETGGIGTRRPPARVFEPLPGVTIRSDEDVTTITSPFTGGVPTPLGDRVDVEGAGFVLRERREDVVKIGGRRITVGEVEAIVRGVPGVEDVAVRPRPAPETRGARLAAIVVGDAELATIRAVLAAALDAEFVPRAIVRVPRIARSASGKLAIDSFARQLESGLRVAQSGLVLRCEGERFVVDVPDTASRFDGHFPDQPILPGLSILLDVVTPAVHAWHGDLAWPRRLTRVKFVRPVRPNDTLVLTMNRSAADLVAFQVQTHAGSPVASGKLDFATDAPPRSTP